MYYQHTPPSYMTTPSLVNTEASSATILRRTPDMVKAGNSLLIFSDANEYILNGPLCGMIYQEGLDFDEILHKHWPFGQMINTFTNGSNPINRVYCTNDVEDENPLSLSFNESLGNHHSTLVEISTRSAIDKFQSNIICHTIWRLTVKQPSSVAPYNKSLKKKSRSIG